MLSGISKDIKIEFWHPWPGQLANLVQTMSDEFNQENEWDITIKPVSYSDERLLGEQLLSISDEGENRPELVAAPGYLLAGLAEDGLSILDLEPFIESPEWGFSEDEINHFFPLFWSSDFYKGVRIAIPAYRTGYFLVYNQSWGEELGFSLLSASVQEFQEQICAASKNNQLSDDPEKNGTGGWIYSTDPYAFASWIISFEGGFFQSDSGEIRLNTPENVDAGNFLYDIYVPGNDCAWKAIQTTPYQYLSNRQTVAYSGKLEDILIQDRVMKSTGSEDKWTLIPYPSVSGKPVLLIGGSSYAILTDDGEKSLASWLFIRWMLEPENQKRIIEETGSFPLSTTVISLLADFKQNHPEWSSGLSYLPFAEDILTMQDWQAMSDILSDIAWQITLFTTSREDIPLIFNEAENLLKESIES